MIERCNLRAFDVGRRCEHVHGSPPLHIRVLDSNHAAIGRMNAGHVQDDLAKWKAGAEPTFIERFYHSTATPSGVTELVNEQTAWVIGLESIRDVRALQDTEQTTDVSSCRTLGPISDHKRAMKRKQYGTVQ